MGVIIPGYHLKSGHDLPNLRRKLKGGGKHRSIHQELSLTSMIDMFSMLIIFLIQSFSTAGDAFLTDPNIKMPSAQHAKMLERSPIITITPEKVVLEGAAVGDNADINEKIEETDWNLPALVTRLDEYKKFFESVHTDAKFPGEVIVQADRTLPFVFLKRVMYSLAKIGFTNVNLAVRGEAQGAIERPEAEGAAAGAPVGQPVSAPKGSG